MGAGDYQQYKVGRFILQPFRQLLEGDAPVSIGRKPLEILSVLAQAGGALVTKDELMAAVWPQAVVEENALQVQIAALRKLLGAEAELLSTVHGFGYRLAATPAAALPEPSPPAQDNSVTASPRRPRLHMGLPAALAVLSLVSMAAAGLWFLRDGLPLPARPREARVAVLPFDTDDKASGAREFADGLLDEIVRELSDNQIQTVSRTESRSLRGAAAGPAIDKLGVDLILDGAVQSDGKTTDVHLYLDDARERVSIWSDEIRGPADAPQALQAQVAAQAADVVYWAKTGRSGKVRLDAATLAAFIAGRESTTGVRNGSNALAYYRKVVAAAPDFSWGHSGVAVTDAFASLGVPVHVDAPNDPLRAEVQQEARRALVLEPHNGEAYVALELALPISEWTKREALILKGAAMDPNFEPGALMEGRLLWHVGRGQEALGWFRRAHDLGPLHNGETWSLALNLAEEGHSAESRALVSQMQLQWPHHNSTKDARFWTSLETGATDAALALLADPAARPSSMNQHAADAWSDALKAIASGDLVAKAVAIQTVQDAVDTGFLNHGHALTLLAMLGDLDGAFAQAELYQPADPYSAPYLFLSTAAPMRSDHRFMALAGKLGYVAYWRATGHWPDFCSQPGLPYDCQAEAGKAVKYVRN